MELKQVNLEIPYTYRFCACSRPAIDYKRGTGGRCARCKDIEERMLYRNHYKPTSPVSL